jgi:DNA-binding GntR family transcriptional regulator
MLRDIESNGSLPFRLPPEEQLARRYGVSRATIRKTLQHLNTSGVIRISGHAKKVIRYPFAQDFFAIDETESSPRERVEDHLVDWLCRAKEEGKTHLTETELAAEVGCSRSIIREELARVSYYGLVVKEPHRGWRVIEYTTDMLLQIFEVREMFELHAIRKTLALADDSPIWKEFEYLEDRLQQVSRSDSAGLARAVELDKRFHDTLLRVCGNPYMGLFHNMSHLLIDYNWRRRGVMHKRQERILIGLDDHMKIVKALRERNQAAALDAMQEHFGHARALILENL